MHEPLQDLPLPPDLAHVEQYLRSDETAAPMTLLMRIDATRSHSAAVRSALPARTPNRWRRIATVAGVAGIAATIAILSILRRDAPDTSTRIQPLASGRTRPRSNADEVSRLLQPWPTVAQAQSVARNDQTRGRGAPLEPGARPRLSPSLRTYARVLKDASGRERLRTNVLVQLDWVRYRVDGHWLLRTQLRNAQTASVQEIDSISLDTRTLFPLQRRLHTAGLHRYFRYRPRQVEATDTLPEFFFDKTFVTSRRSLRSLWSPTPRRSFWYAVGELDPKRTLVLSETHLQLLLRTLPLSRDWTMTVEFGAWGQQLHNRPTSLLTLRVAAIDTLATPTGKTPCYRVELDYGARPDIWWISENTGEFVRGVRTTADPVMTETTTLESVQPLRR